MIQSFMDTGAYHPNTTFWRSDRKTTQGVSAFWFMTCPDCGETGEAVCTSFNAGRRPCACTKQRQKQGYINIVTSNSSVLAVKFGIANSYNSRVSQQNRASVYTILNHAAYSFPDVFSCKAAERECHSTLDCGVLTKEEMPDGYTETTSLHNINRITDIFERHGGVLV